MIKKSDYIRYIIRKLKGLLWQKWYNRKEEKWKIMYIIWGIRKDKKGNNRFVLVDETIDIMGVENNIRGFWKKMKKVVDSCK